MAIDWQVSRVADPWVYIAHIPTNLLLIGTGPKPDIAHEDPNAESCSGCRVATGKPGQD